MVGEKFERTGTKRLHREGGNLRLGLGFGKRKLCIALATWAEKKGVRRYGIIGLQNDRRCGSNLRLVFQYDV